MKTAIDNNGNEVQVENNITVKTIDGIHYLLTPSEQAELEERQQAWEIESDKRNALKEIARLEAEADKPRRRREFILGIDGGWLDNQNNLIAIERAKL